MYTSSARVSRRAGGTKPRKPTKELNGKTLLAWPLSVHKVMNKSRWGILDTTGSLWRIHLGTYVRIFYWISNLSIFSRICLLYSWFLFCVRVWGKSICINIFQGWNYYFKNVLVLVRRSSKQNTQIELGCRIDTCSISIKHVDVQTTIELKEPHPYSSFDPLIQLKEFPGKIF